MATFGTDVPVTPAQGAADLKSKSGSVRKASSGSKLNYAIFEKRLEVLACGEHHSRPISSIGSMAALFRPPSHLR
jgi:hypothetical protein